MTFVLTTPLIASFLLGALTLGGLVGWVKLWRWAYTEKVAEFVGVLVFGNALTVAIWCGLFAAAFGAPA